MPACRLPDGSQGRQGRQAFSEKECCSLFMDSNFMVKYKYKIK